MSKPEDDAVIPLSRWRAALARARLHRRADALIAEPDAARLVPRLPMQELYFAIQEVGLADAHELVALASPEQLQGFLDLDAWERDQFDSSRMAPWIDALVEAGPEKLGAVMAALDPEEVALYLARQARIYDLELDQPPDEPEGHFYPTPDRFFLLDILPAGERGKALERMIDWLYRADLELGRRVVMSAKWELPSDLEEHAYRWRSGRMADLGYAEFYDALSVYRFLDPASVRLDEGTGGVEEPAARLPVQLTSTLDPHGMLARALGTISDERELERLQAQLMTLVNRVMAADLVAPGDLAAAGEALGRVAGYLGLGVEYLGRGNLSQAGRALSTVALERIFRVGVSLTLQLKTLADTLWEKGRVRVGALLLIDPPFDAVLEALRLTRPQYPAVLDEAGPPRPFSTLAEIGRAAAALSEAAEAPPLVWDGLGLDPADAAAEIFDPQAQVGAVKAKQCACTFPNGSNHERQSNDSRRPAAQGLR
jgi:hypothetical protein